MFILIIVDMKVMYKTDLYLFFFKMPKEFDTYILYDTQQGSRDWLERRKGMITASNIGKIMQCSGDPRGTGHAPYCNYSPEDLALILKGEKKEEFSEESKKRMNLGNIYEPIVRNILEKKLNTTINETGYAVWKQDKNFGASLDGIIDEDTGIEIKCPRKMYKPLLDRIKNPDKYESYDTSCIWKSQYDQIIANGVITGRKNMIFAVYSIDEKLLYIQNVKVDYEYWNTILYPVCKNFFDKYM